ncbi:MAG TPA: pentapeptide repeat-containing protein [Oscillatoriaceae cyanobacterium]
MKPSVPRMPVLPDPNGPAELQDGLEDLETYDDLTLTGGALAAAAGVTLKRAHLTYVGLNDGFFRQLELIDARLTNCNLSNAEWPRASATRLLLEDCRLTGFKPVAARFDHARFVACHARYAIFENVIFRHARFEQCLLADTSFKGADLSGVVFADCDLTNATFKGAKLAGTDFRTSRIEASQIALDELRGALISPLQAIALLGSRTGAVVSDEA